MKSNLLPMKYVNFLLFLMLSSYAFSQDLSHISENDTIFLVLPQNNDMKDIELNFKDFKLSYMGTKEYGAIQYSFNDLSGNGRISLNTQDDSPSPYMVKNNITVKGPEFLKKHKNSIITLKSIENYGYRKFFYETLKVQNRKLHKYYVIYEADLKKKTIILRKTHPYSFD